MITPKVLIPALLFCTSTAAASPNPAGLDVESLAVSSGNQYTTFNQKRLSASFDLKRPEQSDASILLSIPCAFTNVMGTVDGVYICKGKLHHGNSISNQFGGAAVIINGTIDLIPTNKGAALTPGFLDAVVKRNGSLFQQFLIVSHGQAASFKDRSLFQRRAIVKFKNVQTVIFESKSAITLNQFAQDLKSAGAVNALYTDMGAWDEGWYRDWKGKVRTIGLDRSLTAKQSNWLTFRTGERTRSPIP